MEGWLEIRVVLEGGIDAHPVVVLNPALRWQSVVVPAHGVEDVIAPHPLETGDDIGVGVREDMTHVQVAGHRGRRGVDGIDGLAVAGVAEAVDLGLLPVLAPLLLQAIHAHPVGQGGQAGVDDSLVFSRHTSILWTNNDKEPASAGHVSA